MTGVEEVLKQCENSPTEVARRVTEAGQDCIRQDVEYWKRVGYVPPTFAPIVSETFNVPLHKLNESVYPKRLTA